jgi:type I restriction enzyme, S subunit
MWTTRTLGDICDEVDGIVQTGPFGSQLHESDYVSEGIPVVMPKNIIDGRVMEDGIARINEENAERLSRHRLHPGDIVYGRRGDIGRRALVDKRQSGWLCGTGCLRISLGDRILDSGFLYYYLGQIDVVRAIANQAIGATLPNLNTGIIRNISISYPELAVQRQIARALAAYDDLIDNNLRRNRVLRGMRDILLPKLFDAESKVISIWKESSENGR